MQVAVIIIGQGLCGTWLSYYLSKAGISFVVIDKPQKHTASTIASGIINPVTGRRLVKTWMIDEVMSFSVVAYQNFTVAQQLAASLITPCNVLDFFSAPDVELTFNNRLSEQADYLSPVTNIAQWRSSFQFNFGAGEIAPCYLVDVNGLLQNWRGHLQSQKMLVQEQFIENELKLTSNVVQYGNITAERIVYCDGINAAQSTYFNKLPFAPNKGEALIAEIPDLAPTHIFKKGMSLVPWTPGKYWIGSSYQWKFDDALPTDAFRQQATNWLQSFCKLPYSIIDHLASVRPATIERRPFIGFHPLHPQVGIFNGMGTKGVSLAPYFASAFTQHLSENTPLMADVDILRYAKILSR